MKHFLLFAMTLYVSVAYSQISISQADMPNAGDTLRISYSNDTLSPMLTDTAYTWDFSYLTPNSQWVNSFDNPSTFVFPFNLLFNPSNTSYGLAQYTPDSIPVIGIKPDNSYAFLKKSSSKYQQVGAGLTINALPIPFLYSPHDTIYRFPVNYGNVDSSDAKFGLQIPNMGYYGQKIHRVNYVDGWGTLITPFGTFQSIRVKSLVTMRDTFADTSGVGFAFTRPLKYEFKWLVNGGKIPYLEVDANDVGGNPVISQISYRDSIRDVLQIGINEIPVWGQQFSVFPNPSNEYAFFQYELNVAAEIKTEIYDISGRRIKLISEGKHTIGKQLEVISTREIEPGIYFIKLSSGHQSTCRKLVVLR